MLFKNTKPLRKQAKTLSDDAADLAALRALAGLHCSVCDQPLSQKDHKAQWGYVRKHSAYTCCGVAHCPFCGASAKENCPHLVATRASGGWHIYGLPDVAKAGVPQPAPLTPDNLLDHSPAQKEAAYGAAYPLLEKLFGFKWYGKPCEKISAQLLVDQLLPDANREDVFTPSGCTNTYYFASDAGAVSERLERVLVRDMPDAFARLAEQPIANPSYLAHAFALEKTEKYDVVSFVGYSPCGTKLIALSNTRGEIWDLDGDTPRRTGSFTIDAATKDFRYFSATFSASGETVDVWRLFEGYRADQERIKIETRAVSDGSLVSTETCSAKDLTIISSLTSSRERRAKIYDGSVLVTTRTNIVRLYHLNEKGRKKKGISIPLRRSISHLAVSPDGKTFATAGDCFVCLWNVPQEAVLPDSKRQRSTT